MIKYIENIDKDTVDTPNWNGWGHTFTVNNNMLSEIVGLSNGKYVIDSIEKVANGNDINYRITLKENNHGY